MRAKQSRRWLGAAALFGVCALLYYFFAAAPTETAAPSRPAPDFSFPDIDHRTVTLSSYKGKIVLVDFWATWCEPCLEELPDLARFHEAHKNQGFTILGVAMDAEGTAIVAPFVRQNKIPYPILISGGDLPSGYPIPGFPAAFLIDREGKIVRRYLGPKSYEELERDVAQLQGH